MVDYEGCLVIRAVAQRQIIGTVSKRPSTTSWASCIGSSISRIDTNKTRQHYPHF